MNNGLKRVQNTLILLALFAPILGCQARRPVAALPKSHDFTQVLEKYRQLKFVVGLGLDLDDCHVVRCDSPILVSPPECQLVVIHRGKPWITIETMDDLKWHTAIAHASQALTLVRLTTGDATFDAGLADWVGWEIAADGALRDRSDGGKIPERLVKKLGLRPVVVKRHGGGWEIRRFVVELPTAYPSDKWRIARLLETVDETGEYHRVNEKQIYSGPLPLEEPPGQL